MEDHRSASLAVVHAIRGDALLVEELGARLTANGRTALVCLRQRLTEVHRRGIPGPGGAIDNVERGCGLRRRISRGTCWPQVGHDRSHFRGHKLPRPGKTFLSLVVEPHAKGFGGNCLTGIGQVGQGWRTAQPTVDVQRRLLVGRGTQRQRHRSRRAIAIGDVQCVGAGVSRERAVNRKAVLQRSEFQPLRQSRGRRDRGHEGIDPARGVDVVGERGV